MSTVLELEQEDIAALLANTADERIRVPARAWLAAYHHAHHLAYNETVSHQLADAAWDCAVRVQAQGHES